MSSSEEVRRKRKREEEEEEKERIYVDFIENNEWEGERWHFFIELRGNEKNIKILREQIQEEEECDYELNDTIYDEDEVNTLLEESNTGYMDEFNKINGKMMEGPYDFDQLYKGGIYSYIEDE